MVERLGWNKPEVRLPTVPQGLNPTPIRRQVNSIIVRILQHCEEHFRELYGLNTIVGSKDISCVLELTDAILRR